MTPHTTRRMTPRTIRALSIRRPWAALIVAGVKDIENRSWSTQWRGTLVIHAGQHRDPYPTRDAVRQLLNQRPDTVGLDRPGYLGAVQLTDVHPDRGCCRPWGEPGAVHWVLRAPFRLAEIRTGPGRLGIYSTIPADVLAEVAEITGGAEIGGSRKSANGERK